MQILEELKETFGSIAEVRQAIISNKTDDYIKIIEFLMKNEKYQKDFFIEVSGKAIFNKDKFLELLDDRELDKSYTKFSNKIGLGFKAQKRFLKAQDEVVLNFPYKDCVLKGSQDKDDAKSKEIFFNEILASNEIDVLFKPKALCDFELIQDSNGGGQIKA